MVRAYAATAPHAPLVPHEYEFGPLGHDQVEIKIQSCGICHSDLSMIDNEWGMTHYPFVAGHEIIGTIAAKGEHVTHLSLGQTVGLGWYSGSCNTCKQCMSGDQNLCITAEGTMLGRPGGFATRVRAQGSWVVPLPVKLDAEKAGPLFCGGVTVFNPMLQFGVKPTDRVAVIGIGGLGHMSLQFLSKWGCEVTAFTTSKSKEAEAIKLGAHQTLNPTDAKQLAASAGKFDFIISTINASLNWDAVIGTLAPRGRLHIVGAVAEPIPVTIFPMLLGQKSLSASPLGSPQTLATMLDFAGRHGIAPITETFPLSKVNDALDHLRAGKARYRIVLKNDLE
jgi:uncharacterized zinc-type alcohol dehydrogenase-like protein